MGRICPEIVLVLGEDNEMKDRVRRRRIGSVILSVAMLIGCMALPVSADDVYIATSWAGLKDAIDRADVSIIRLENNITTEGVIEIRSGRNISLEMNGYALQRSIGSQSDNGQVILVDSGANLQIYGSGYPDRGHGTIKGGFAYNGGGINNKGTLDISYVDIIDNNVGDTTAVDNSRGGGIWNSGTLTMGACTISGNKTDDGGGIFNAEGGSIILTDVTITDNTSLLHGGGGIVNYGSITFQGETTITGNTSKSNGGGIWNWGSLIIDDSDNKLVIKDNNSTDYYTDNLFLYRNTYISLENDAVLSSNTEIYVSAEKLPTVITRGWKYGENQTMIMAEADMMLGFSNGELTGSVLYVKREWVDNKIKETSTLIPDGVEMVRTSDGQAVQDHLNTGAVRLSDCWLYVDKNTEWADFLAVYGTVNLVLKDGVTFRCNKGIEVLDGATLNIYGQTDDSGILIAQAQDSYRAGIGGKQNMGNGTIVIHGGNITATGSSDGAGIGTGDEAGLSGAPIVIYGGTVTATGGSRGAGIGGGQKSSGGPITIYGGKVTAKGSDQGRPGDLDSGAGIGSGECGDYCATIKIYGGEVYATADKGAAGIGGGAGADSWETAMEAGGTIEIHGGSVTAKGGKYSAGIGGGSEYNSNHTIKISGGTVVAYASAATETDLEDNGAAGIGAGTCGTVSGGDFRGTIEISGGTVKAYGSGRFNEESCGGAGIGAGWGGNMTGTITLSGGDIEVVSRKGGACIGAGSERFRMGGEMTGTVSITGTAAVKIKMTANTVYDSTQMIGYGAQGDESGSLVLGGNMMVFFDGEEVQKAEDRVKTCRPGKLDKWLYIQPCTHPGHTYIITRATHQDQCIFCSAEIQPVAHTYDSHDKCTACGYERSDPEFKGHSVLLSGTIGLKFFVDLIELSDTEKASAYMTFVFTNKGNVIAEEVKSSGTSTQGYDEFVVELNAIQMADEITATFHYYKNDEWRTLVETYSVKQYCTDFETEWNKTTTHTREDYDYKTLVEALADYGHYLQIYLKGVRGWSFDAVTGHAQMDKFYSSSYYDGDRETLCSRVGIIGRASTSPDIKSITYSMTFDSETCINIYFEMAEGADYTGSFVVEIAGNLDTWSPGSEHQLITGERVSLEKLSNGQYRLKIAGVYAQNLDKTYDITVRTDSPAADTGKSALVHVCGLYYARDLVEKSTKTGSDDAGVAIYKYFLAATACAPNS